MFLPKNLVSFLQTFDIYNLKITFDKYFNQNWEIFENDKNFPRVFGIFLRN